MHKCAKINRKNLRLIFQLFLYYNFFFVCFFLFYPDSSSPGYPVSVSFPSVNFEPWADSQRIDSGLHPCNPCIGCPIVSFIYGGSACRSQLHICSCKSFWYANCYRHSSFTCFYSFKYEDNSGRSYKIILFLL